MKFAKESRRTPKTIVQNAKDFGITTYIRPVDAIALGVSEVYPIEITAAYGTIANNGIYSHPLAITKIEDRHGRIIKEFLPNFMSAVFRGQENPLLRTL